MTKYKVWFTQYYSYEVEAEDEDTAIDLAYEDFDIEMHRPIARTYYDECEVEELEEDCEVERDD